MSTIQDVKIGDRVRWTGPGTAHLGCVVDVNYTSVKIRWDDGATSIMRKADGFVSWVVMK